MQGFSPRIVTAVLVAAVTTAATSAGSDVSNVAPGSSAVCVTVKLPQLPQA